MYLSIRSFALVILLLLALNVAAQDTKEGNVVVHADPRLQLLLKPHSSPDVTPQPPAPSVAIKEKKQKPEQAKQHKIEVNEEGKPATTIPSTATKMSAPSGPTRVTIGMQGEKVITPTPQTSPTTSPNAWPPVHTSNPAVANSRGYRVQIYNGPDRNKAAEVKSDFMRRYPGVHCYLIYTAPSFRVKVGDYATHSSAEIMFKQIKPHYSVATMIVPDNIVAPKLPNN